jgi:hypothetical protein
MSGLPNQAGEPHDSANSAFLRVLFAYTVGLNAFGLVLALTFLVGSFFQMANAVALVGGIVGVVVGVAAGLRTESALKRLFR